MLAVADDKVRQFPIRTKQRRTLEVVQPPYNKCQHVRALLDEKLAELTCADCGERLNPIAFLKTLAQKATMWEWEAERIAKVRADLDERSKCRCTKCGQMTEIRRVHKRELAALRASNPTEGSPT